MRSTFVICSLFVILALANAETMEKARLRAKSAIEKDIKSETSFLALKESPFGKNLFAMMSLKFKSTGRLDTLNTLLSELSSNIGDQQAADDTEYQTTSAQFQATIDEQGRIYDQAVQNIADWTAAVADKKDTLRQKKEQRDSLIAEDEAIRAFLVELKATRERETASYEERMRDQQAILDGVTEVISLLSAECDTNTELDRASCDEVLALLAQIKSAIISSMDEDTRAEQEAQAKYVIFVADQTKRLDDIDAELKGLNAEIPSLETEISTLETNIGLEESKRDGALQLKQETEAALATLTENYNNNRQVRADQLTLLGQVRSRLNDNPAEVTAMLNS